MYIFSSTSSRKITLRLVLVLAFVAQGMAIAGMVAYVSYRNGQEAVNAVAQRLRSDQSEQISQHLESFLKPPIRINISAADFIRSTGLTVDRLPALQEYFLQQVHIHDSVTSIYFGTGQGGIVGGGREGADEIYYVYSTGNLSPGVFNKYAASLDGAAGELLTSIPDFDARLRPWYQNAVQNNGPAWSDIYILFTGQDMAIAASSPVRDEAGQLLGVVSVDIFLSHLSSFLDKLEVSSSGESYIMDRAGFLVAVSTGEALFADGNGDGELERLQARESNTPVIRESTEALAGQMGDFQEIHSAAQIEFDLDGKRHFAQVLPIRDEYGIDWLIVVVVPESDFMGPIHEANRYALLIVLVAALLSIGMSIWAAYRINRPIRHLIGSMEAISDGEWGEADARSTRIFEIHQLAGAFNRMKRALREVMDHLSEEIRRREQVELSLRESEDRYRTLLDNVPIGVFRTSHSGKFLAANPASLNMLNLENVEALEGADVIDFYAAPQDRGALLDLLQSQGSVRNMEILFKKQNGGFFWGSITARAVTDANGNMQYIDGTMEDITEKKKIRENLKYLATHDSLTGIANRNLFDDRLAHAIDTAKRNGRKFALLFLDLDDFKKVNDEFGHAQGDWLLQQVVHRLSHSVRASDSVARLGGDEFAVILEGLSRADHILPVIHKILRAVSAPCMLHQREIRVSTSIGVSIFPEDGGSPDDLLQNADRAMYEAKDAGKNNFQFFSSK